MGALLIALQAGAATARRSEVDARDRPAGDRGEGQLALGGDAARSAHVGGDQSLVVEPRLRADVDRLSLQQGLELLVPQILDGTFGEQHELPHPIRRASCGERVGQYGYISVVAVS